MRECGFYEREDRIRDGVESQRSELCYTLLTDLIKASEGVRKKILDVGCGDGRFIVQFKEICDVFGVDISQVAVNKARHIAINAYKIDASSEKLPFDDSFFDIVYIGDVIEHLVDPDFALEEIRRVLRPEGTLCLSTPNLASWYNRILLFLGIQPIFTEVSSEYILGRKLTLLGQHSKPVGHLRLFTLSSLRDLLELHEYNITSVYGAANYYVEKKSVIMRLAEHIFSHAPSLASIMIAVANPKKR